MNVVLRLSCDGKLLRVREKAIPSMVALSWMPPLTVMSMHFAVVAGSSFTLILAYSFLTASLPSMAASSPLKTNWKPRLPLARKSLPL